jgi:hypothetical protein
MMRDVTDLMDHYRVVARSTWNTAFWSQPDLQNWDSRDHFREIRKLLFNALVIARLHAAYELPDALGAFQDCSLQVVPGGSSTVPIMIERPREGDQSHNRYWDDPVNEIKASDAKLVFIDYFDWNEMGYIDFQYYKVRIVSFASHPHLVGREALLEHQNAIVVADVALKEDTVARAE